MSSCDSLAVDTRNSEFLIFTPIIPKFLEITQKIQLKILLSSDTTGKHWHLHALVEELTITLTHKIL